MRYLQSTLKMTNIVIKLFFIFISTLLFSCSNAQNDKDASVVVQDGHTFIKLSGKRKLMAHNPISLAKGETYKDSILIEVPAVKDGIIEGKDIPVKKGYYHYLGSLTIKGKQLTVNLLIDDTDDKKQQPLSWNGEYNLKLSD
jgi:hypothetical protein